MKKYLYIVLFLIISIIADYTDSKGILFICSIVLIFSFYKILKEIGVIET